MITLSLIVLSIALIILKFFIDVPVAAIVVSVIMTTISLAIMEYLKYKSKYRFEIKVLKDKLPKVSFKNIFKKLKSLKNRQDIKGPFPDDVGDKSS